MSRYYIIFPSLEKAIKNGFFFKHVFLIGFHLISTHIKKNELTLLNKTSTFKTALTTYTARNVRQRWKFQKQLTSWPQKGDGMRRDDSYSYTRRVTIFNNLLQLKSRLLFRISHLIFVCENLLDTCNLKNWSQGNSCFLLAQLIIIKWQNFVYNLIIIPLNNYLYSFMMQH